MGGTNSRSNSGWNWRSDLEEHVPYFTMWDEENQRWTAHLGQDKETLYIWNQETSSWDAQ